MVTATSERQADAWLQRAAPSPERILPGLWAIALPAVDNPIAYTIDYLFETGTGLALIDTGWGGESSLHALEHALGEIGWSTADIEGVLVTHMHPDHFGLIPTLLDADPALRLYMHDDDLRLVDERGDELRARTTPRWQRLMRSIGAPDSLDLTRRARLPYRLDPSHAAQIVAVAAGSRIPLGGWTLRALWTPGHTPGHLCFLIEGHDLLITGDHVLPTITPQITQLSDPDDDPLGRYLASLADLRVFDGAEVLPAHQYRFAELGERIDELLAHHDRRLAILERSVQDNPGRTCFELAPELDWRTPLDEMPIEQARMAVRETLAHLLHLRETARVERVDENPATWWPVKMTEGRTTA